MHEVTPTICVDGKRHKWVNLVSVYHSDGETNDHEWLGGSMVTMEDTINELKEIKDE